MVNKQHFTPEEWTKILESPILVGMAVSAADPNGLWGTIKEAVASRSAITASGFAPGCGDFIKTVIADFQSSEGRTAIQDALHKRLSGVEPGDIVQRSLDNLREVSAILNERAPDEAVAFKAWLRGISQTVAEASLEGGFLGIGGVRVSEAEKATLNDIAKALGVPV
jgi:hypothetical protein